MKTLIRTLAIFSIVALATPARAIILASDFSDFAAQLFPPMTPSWNNGVDQYTQNSGFISITSVNGGNPGGDGNFTAGFPGAASVDFSTMSFANLNASVDIGNASTSVTVTFLDDLTTAVATATFSASSFTSVLSTQSVLLSYTNVGNLAAVTYWRVEGDGIPSDAFRFSFSDLSVSTVAAPEPSALLLGLFGIGCVGTLVFRKKRAAPLL